MLNWNIFSLKENGKEQAAFENLSYLLFCAEFENRIGLFRYKNQTGIETEPFEKDGKTYGFQAKYYTTALSKNKTDIIDSIKKAKEKNDKINIIFLYLNQELSESTKRGRKKPAYQIEIENTANTLGLEVEWRTPSHFELQLALPENKYIFNIFFSLDQNELGFMNEIETHNKTLLNSIQTKIDFNDKTIKIDRNDIVDKIKSAIQEKKVLIISGEGGSGKTALLKDFYDQYHKIIPISIFKASELNVKHINDIFKLDNSFTLSQFLNMYKDNSQKIFVIDSAERLQEFSNNDILITLIERLKENNWCVIFTTRYVYQSDLCFHIRESYELQFEIFEIALIDKDFLLSLTREYEFSLPNNLNFADRLRNLFYLKEYLCYYSQIDKSTNYNDFIELLWKKRIQNVIQNGSMNLEREKCIINIVKKRCETGQYYIQDNEQSSPALKSLVNDEILGYEESFGAYFITHDVYEEWTLNKIILQSYLNNTNITQFFKTLGSTLPMRRAFRLWLSNQLLDNKDSVSAFIKEATTDSKVLPFWKDEILVSILLSEHSKNFVHFLEQEKQLDIFEILKRILFLLQIACTDIDMQDIFETKKPKGDGWITVISFIFEHKDDFFSPNVNLVLPVLSIWCSYNKTGETTKKAGLLALSIIQESELNNKNYHNASNEETVLKIVFNASTEIQSELKVIFEKIIKNKWIQREDPYYSISSTILKKPYLASEVFKTQSLSIIQLCNLFWKQRPRNSYMDYYDRDTMENKYGIPDKFEDPYFPASANQTPIRWLLQSDLLNTIDFIIGFTNKAVETYSTSDYGKKDVTTIKLYINNAVVEQYFCEAFWLMYRGSGSPVVPDLLQSIHMALETVLLDIAEVLDSHSVETILLKILATSKSTSLTSIVCSIVLANPNKLYKIAMILFKTIEFFHMDYIRYFKESEAKFLSTLGYSLDYIKGALYSDERKKSCEQKHRSNNLENLLFRYQFSGIKGFAEEKNSEFIKQLYDIIDLHKKDVFISQKYGILLARMDRRNLEVTGINHEDNSITLELNPNVLSEEHRKASDAARKEKENVFKYTALKLWSDFLHKKQQNDDSEISYKRYDNNPKIALKEVKQLIKELKAGTRTNSFLDYSIPSHVCAKLMIEHRSILNTKEKAFCKDVILTTAAIVLDATYSYQIGDGVEAAIHAIPVLFDEYPDEVIQYVNLLTLILLDDTSIGQYKRVCDYVIESVHIANLWRIHQLGFQTILFNFITLKPLYKKIIQQKHKEKGYYGRISKKEILDELDKLDIDFGFKDVSPDANTISILDIHDLEIAYKLIPSDTRDSKNLMILEKTIFVVASKIMVEDRSFQQESNTESLDYSTRINLYKRVAEFILQRDICEIDRFLTPFLDHFSASKETASFIEYFVLAEDCLRCNNQFWYVWDKMYKIITELCNNSHNHNSEAILVNYLLVFQWWNEKAEEWHSLTDENMRLYYNISKDTGNNPTVLYAISRLLNTIGSKFTNEGIDCIYIIVSNNIDINLKKQEGNTIYYLETFFRKYIFKNKTRIKKDTKLKNKIIPILNFMIERGSIHGYLLRESLL